MKLIAYIFFRVIVFIFWLIPFPLLYLISDVLRFLLKHVLKYRVSVIQKNIDFIFPAKSHGWRADVANKFYKNFVDILLESIKGLSIPADKLIKRYRFRNPELMNALYENNKHVIIYSLHQNNWEWAPLCLGLQIKHHIVGAVKMLSNPYINDYLQNGRSGNNVSVIPTFKVGSYFQQLKAKEKPEGIVFIADQRPSGKETKIPVTFMGQEINFHGGAARYAILSGYPIVNFDILRIGRGRYEVEAVYLGKEGEYNNPKELTQKYADHISALIHANPSQWLWSHKRFKETIKY